MVVNRQFSDFLGWVQRGAPPSNILHPSEGFLTPHRENIQPTPKEEISALHRGGGEEGEKNLFLIIVVYLFRMSGGGGRGLTFNWNDPVAN
jgi:hypothetical protein